MSELKTRLAEGKAQIEVMDASLRRMSSAYDGSKVISQAAATAAAIQNLGGVSKLTGAEQDKANRIYEQAAEKLTALGRTEAAAMYRKLADETKRVAVETEQATQKTRAWGETFTATLAGFVSGQAIWNGLTGAFNAVVGAVGAVKDAVVGAVMSTAALGDMLLTTSKKFDVSVERASAWRYVAAQAGTSLDAIMSNVGKLQVQIGAGGDKVEKSLGALGTSLSAIRSMRPDEAFEQILVKLRDVPRESDRAAIGVGLFGKGFREVAQLTREDIGAMMARFGELGGTISTEMALAGDAFNDARGDWNLIVERITTGVGSAILPAATAFVNVMVSAVQKTLNDSGVSAAQFEAQITRSFASVVDIMALMVRAVGFLVPALGEVFGGKMLRDATTMIGAVSALGLQFIQTAKVIDLLNNQGRGGAFLAGIEKGLKDTLAAAYDAARVTTEVGLSFAKLGTDLDKIGQEMKGKGAAALAEVKAQVAASAAEMKKAQEAIATGGGVLTEGNNKLTESIKKVRDAYTGDGAIKAAQEWAKAVMENGRLIPGTAAGLQDLARAFTAAASAGKPLTPEVRALGVELMKLGLIDVPIAGVKEFGTTIAAIKPIARDSGAAIAQLGLQDIPIFAAGSKEATKSTLAMLGSLEQLPPLAKVTGTDLAGVGKTIQDVFANINSTLGQSMQMIGGAFTAIGNSGGDMAKKLIAGFGAAAGVIGQYANASALAAIASGALSGASAGLALNAALVASKTIAAGTAMGAAFAGVGAAVGALIGWYQYAKQKADALKAANVEATESIEEMKKKILDMYGSVSNLKTIGEIIGVDLVQGWGHQGAEGLKQFREQVEAFMGRMEDLTKNIDKNAGLADATMLRLIAQFEKVKETAEIANDFIVANVKNAAAGLNALLTGLAEGLGGAFLQTQQQAAGLSSAIAASFGEMIARGVSFAEALAAVQPSIDAMREQLDAAGLQGGAAFDSLSEMARIAGDSIMGPLVSALGGARDALTGLHNSNVLTQESFSAVVSSAMQAYQGIIAGGGDANAALAMMQPTLQTIWKLQQDFGYAVDVGTQALLDQAEAAGLVGAARMTDAQRQTAALEGINAAMGELLGYFQRLLPAADQWGEAAAQAAAVAGEALRQTATDAEEAGGKIRRTVTDLEAVGAAADRLGDQLRDIPDEEITVWANDHVTDVVDQIEQTLAALPREVRIRFDVGDAAAAGFQTRAELEKIAFDAGRLWKQMMESGQFTASTLQRAFDAWQTAINNIDPGPLADIAAAGYQTRAALEEAAAASGRMYERMRESGLYTADVLEKAWDDWQADLEAAGMAGTDGLTRAIRDELDKLKEYVATELPEFNELGERIFGVDEQAALDRIAAIEAEAAAASAAIAGTGAAAAGQLSTDGSQAIMALEGRGKEAARAMLGVQRDGEAAFEALRDASDDAAEKMRDALKAADDIQTLLGDADLGEPFREAVRDVEALIRVIERIPVSGSSSYRGPAPSPDTFGPSSSFGYGAPLSARSFYAAPLSSRSDSFTVNVNHPVVRDDRDITRLTDDIMRRLPSRLRQAGY